MEKTENLQLKWRNGSQSEQWTFSKRTLGSISYFVAKNPILQLCAVTKSGNSQPVVSHHVARASHKIQHAHIAAELAALADGTPKRLSSIMLCSTNGARWRMKRETHSAHTFVLFSQRRQSRACDPLLGASLPDSPPESDQDTETPPRAIHQRCWLG